MKADANLHSLLATHITEPLDADVVASTLSTPPWLPTPSLINARALPLPIRPNHVFRSGSAERLSEADQRILHDVGIRKIFDLRSLKERMVNPNPNVQGIQNVWISSTLDNETVPVDGKPEDASEFSVGTPVQGASSDD